MQVSEWSCSASTSAWTSMFQVRRCSGDVGTAGDVGSKYPLTVTVCVSLGSNDDSRACVLVSYPHSPQVEHSYPIDLLLGLRGRIRVTFVTRKPLTRGAPPLTRGDSF